MKYTLLFSFLLLLSELARADMLRLRNGIEFTGHYVGGTKTEIWFERQGMVNTLEIVPTSLVEALKFEPGIGSPAGALPPAQRPHKQQRRHRHRHRRRLRVAACRGPWYRRRHD